MIKLTIPREDTQKILRAKNAERVTATELVEEVVQRIVAKVREGEADASGATGGPVIVTGEYSLNIELTLRDALTELQARTSCPVDDCVLQAGHRDAEHGDDHLANDGTWFNFGRMRKYLDGEISLEEVQTAQSVRDCLRQLEKTALVVDRGLLPTERFDWGLGTGDRASDERAADFITHVIWGALTEAITLDQAAHFWKWRSLAVDAGWMDLGRGDAATTTVLQWFPRWLDALRERQ